MKVRITILWLAALVVLAYVNYGVWQKEDLVRSGEVLLLELGPRDPRSLIQGDYMVLRYDMARQLDPERLARRGQLVVTRDPDGVARFERIYAGGGQLAEDELLLTYHNRNGRITIGPESFFFQEGQADVYRDARYAELRVDPASGASVLTDLRDAELEPLTPADGQ